MEYIDSTGQATGAYTSEKSPDRRDVYTNAYPHQQGVEALPKTKGVVSLRRPRREQRTSQDSSRVANIQRGDIAAFGLSRRKRRRSRRVTCDVP